MWTIIMVNPAIGSLLHYLSRLHGNAAAEVTDGEFVRRHVGGDKAAFAALVRRHAPMVWGVCRRLLDNEQEAEDAFQAAFLVLLRKAESLRAPQSMAAFLHGVASRIARKAVVAAQQSMPNKPGVIVWDRRSGERVRDFPGLCTAVAPDGKQIACGGWGTPDPNRGDIRIYEFATGKLVRVIHIPYSHIHRLTFAPNGQMLFGLVGIPRPPLGNGMSRLGLDPVRVRVWDAATGKERRTGLEGAGGYVPIAFSPDGRTLALADLLLEIATGGQRVELTGHTQGVEGVAFSPDGRTLATGSVDGTVRLWNLPSGKEIARFGKEVPRFGGGWVLAVAFSPDRRALVSGGLASPRTRATPVGLQRGERLSGLASRAQGATGHRSRLPRTSSPQAVQAARIALGVLIKEPPLRTIDA